VDGQRVGAPLSEEFTHGQVGDLPGRIPRGAAPATLGHDVSDRGGGRRRGGGCGVEPGGGVLDYGGPALTVMGKKMYASSAKAVTELGYKVLPVQDALQRAVNWFRENGYA